MPLHCMHVCKTAQVILSLPVKCYSAVKFDDDNTLQIQGEGSNVELVHNDSWMSESLKVFPGIIFNLPFYLTDAQKN